SPAALLDPFHDYQHFVVAEINLVDGVFVVFSLIGLSHFRQLWFTIRVIVSKVDIVGGLRVIHQRGKWRCIVESADERKRQTQLLGLFSRYYQSLDIVGGKHAVRVRILDLRELSPVIPIRFSVDLLVDYLGADRLSISLEGAYQRDGICVRLIVEDGNLLETKFLNGITGHDLPILHGAWLNEEHGRMHLSIFTHSCPRVGKTAHKGDFLRVGNRSEADADVADGRTDHGHSLVLIHQTIKGFDRLLHI